MNGTGVDQNFIPSGSPCGLAVDSGHIYWSTQGQSTPRSLARADLNGTNVESAFVPDLNGGCAVGVDARSLQPTSTIFSVSRDPSTFGDPLFFQAVVAVGGQAPTVPTGGVQITIDGTNIGGPVPLNPGGQAIFRLTFPVDVGSTLSANYLGDNLHSPSAGQLKPTIRPAGTATSLASSANPANEGGQVTIVATTRNADTGITPFGSVQFLVDGAPVLAPQTLDSHGQAGIVGSNLPAGDFTVTAKYHDDTAAIADFADSEASFTQHVTGQTNSTPKPPSGGSGPLPPVIAPIAQPADVALIAGGHPKTTVKQRQGHRRHRRGGDLPRRRAELLGDGPRTDVRDGRRGQGQAAAPDHHRSRDGQHPGRERRQARVHAQPARRQAAPLAQAPDGDLDHDDERERRSVAHGRQAVDASAAKDRQSFGGACRPTSVSRARRCVSSAVDPCAAKHLICPATSLTCEARWRRRCPCGEAECRSWFPFESCAWGRRASASTCGWRTHAFAIAKDSPPQRMRDA